MSEHVIANWPFYAIIVASLVFAGYMTWATPDDPNGTGPK